MEWTDDNEREWREITAKREKNKTDVGRNALVKDLRELADAIDRGEHNLGEINIEFVRGMEIYGYEGLGPVIARKISVMIKVPNN